MLRYVLPLLASIGLSTVGCAQSGSDSMGWRATKSMIARDFPATPTISTDSLAAWLADDARTPPLLLDAREADEYAVSHLARARHVPPNASADSLTALLSDVPMDRSVVVYCSVGYRSAKVTQRLRKAGFSDVHNLGGSIFRWANEGRAVVRGDSAVRTVHPFDATWGRLLDADLRAAKQ